MSQQPSVAGDENALLTRAHNTLRQLQHLRIARHRIADIPDGAFVRSGFSTVKESKLRSRKFLTRPKIVAVKSLGLEGTRYDRIRGLVAFARELHVWSQTTHPNILALKGFIYDESDPQIKEAWIITRWQRLGSISQYLRTGDHRLERRLELAMDTALALAWLHSKNICHGDIKPENTLINDSGKAMLCDFGLARIVATVKSGLTDPGRPKFTPRYASPELFRGESTDNPLPRDVWAWGCLLLVIMTGSIPYAECQNEQSLAEAIRSGQLPGVIPPADSPILDTIGSILEECWQINPTARPDMSNCRATLSDMFFKAAAIATRRPMTQYKSDGNGWELYHIPDSGMPLALEFSLISKGRIGRKYRFSPDGKYIAVADPRGVCLYDTDAGTLEEAYEVSEGVPHSDERTSRGGLDPQGVTEVCFNATGTVLAIGAENGLIQMWDMPLLSSHTDLRGHTGRIVSLIFAYDAPRLVSASVDLEIRVWDLDTNSTLHVHTTNFLPRSLVNSPRHSFFAVVSSDLLQVRRTGTGTCIGSISTSAETVAFTPDGNELITGGENIEGLKIWDLRPATEGTSDEHHELHTFRTLAGPQSSISSLSVSSDGQLVASASWTRDDVALWDLSGQRMEAILTGKFTNLPHATFSPSSTKSSGTLAITTDSALRLLKYHDAPADTRNVGPFSTIFKKLFSSEA